MARRRRRQARRLSSRGPEISLTPLIDMALTLLVIFMITTPMLTNVINIELPESHSTDKTDHPDKFVILIDKDEKLFLNNEPVEKNTLLDRLKALVGDNKHQTIIIKGDKQISYGKFIDILDIVEHVGGFKNVSMATEKA